MNIVNVTDANLNAINQVKLGVAKVVVALATDARRYVVPIVYEKK